MSGGRPTSSFGDSNAQPPTPKQTPTSATFPSPVFSTPQQTQGQFADYGSWTPRFAEDYSVFNSTPGNLRGTADGQFDSSAILTPSSESAAPPHQNLASAASPYSQRSPHAVGLFSPDLNLQLPPTDPAYQLPSTPIRPNITTAHKPKTAHLGPLASPNPSLQASGKQSEYQHQGQTATTQTATPPPTSRKDRRRKPTLKFTMQQDGQEYVQPDFLGTSQPQDLSGLLGSPTDMFSYPMSAPVTAPDNFWDPSSLAMSMDMDFSTTDIFPPTESLSHHRPSGSFDWNNEVQMFQDLQQPPLPSAKPAAPKPQGQGRKTRTLAPKPPANQVTSATGLDSNMGGTGAPMLDSQLAMMGDGGVVDPGILSSRPQTAVSESAFGTMAPLGSAESAIVDTAKNGGSSGGIRRSTSLKGNGKMPDRAFASSPVKSSGPRPGLTRSQSDFRGRKPSGRGALGGQPSAPRPMAPARNGPGVSSGRVSPVKKQNRLSGLASIPESASRPGSRASVKFYIGADGRAHAEATNTVNPFEPSFEIPKSLSTNDLQQWDDELDGSSSDDEPIIIPSRNTSFNTSFALPDPRRPVGSIFHPARRSISDKSTSTLTTSDLPNGLANDGESEAETVMNEGDEEGGDAASELMRVKENRQQLSGQFPSLKSQRLFPVGGNNFHGSSISPTRTDSGNNTDGPDVRCVCHRNDFKGFLVQCESCEMWQHGNCVNQRSQPRVYICAFCANTPNMRGGRLRDTGRAPGSDLDVASSPLARKSFRSLR